MTTFRVIVRHPAAFGQPEAWEQLRRDYATVEEAIAYLKAIRAATGQGGGVAKFDDAGNGSRVFEIEPRLTDEACEAKAAVQEMLGR